MNDLFLISAEAELTRVSRLMNKSSKAYWRMNDRTTPYALQVYSCYWMNKKLHDSILETVKDYKHGKIVGELGSWEK